MLASIEFEIYSSFSIPISFLIIYANLIIDFRKKCSLVAFSPSVYF